MSETFDRPNRATGPREVWEREDGWLCIMYLNCHGSKCYRAIGGDNNCWGYVAELQPDRYRIRTLDEKPWPPKTRVEKRRVVQYQDSKNRYRVAYYAADSEMVFPFARIISDEIRDCEVDESGVVIRVVPFKEGE